MSDDQKPAKTASAPPSVKGGFLSRLAHHWSNFYRSTHDDLNSDNPSVKFRGALKRTAMRSFYALLLTLIFLLLSIIMIYIAVGNNTAYSIFTKERLFGGLISAFTLFYAYNATDWLPSVD